MADRLTPAQLKRQRALNVMAHRLGGAMAGKGNVRVTLASGTHLEGAPDRIKIDESLKERLSNLRVYMGGENFPLDDVSEVAPWG